MENSTATPNNKVTTSSSKGKERSDEDAPPFLELQLTYPCIGRGDRMRGSGSNVSLNAHPNEVTSDGVVAKDAHHLHPFQMITLDEEKKPKSGIARSSRQLARQKSRNLKITSLNASIASPPRSRKSNHAQPSAEGYEEHHPSIYTHDNVKLTFVLQKLLTPSDVSDQGRIVLPKREAEENLPRLHAKEGTLFIMREVLSNTEWQLTYRFWANHKGRIYVLYNCGEFVSKNKLEAGDKLTLYQDVFKNNFFTITKKEKPTSPTSNEHDKEKEMLEGGVGEADEQMSSQTDDSYSTNRRQDIPITTTNRREDVPVFIQFF